MKKLFVFLVFLTFFLSSCGTTKYQDLPTEKQDEIVEKIDEEREYKLKEIDMSNYTDEANLTEENMKKLDERVKEINKEVLDELKETEKGVDFSIIEERLN